MQYIQTTYT